MKDVLIGLVACPDNGSTWGNVQETGNESYSETFNSFCAPNLDDGVE